MPASIFELSGNKSAPAALRSVTEHLFETERAKFQAAGEPAGHLFYDVLVLTKAGLELGESPELKLSRQEYDSMGRVIGDIFGPEHTNWKTAGRPSHHVFVDLLVLGREFFKQKVLMRSSPNNEREDAADRLALRGGLSAPVTEPVTQKESLATPGME